MEDVYLIDVGTAQRQVGWVATAKLSCDSVNRVSPSTIQALRIECRATGSDIKPVRTGDQCWTELELYVATPELAARATEAFRLVFPPLRGEHASV